MIGIALAAVPASPLRAQRTDRAVRVEAYDSRSDRQLRSSATEIQADSVYKAAHEALNDGNYRNAANLFQRVVERYPGTRRASDALYYRAFALSKITRTSDLQTALTTLERLHTDYASAYERLDASTLRIQICGELAKRGDESCAREVVTQANPPARTSTPSSASTPTRTSTQSRPSTESPPASTSQSLGCPREGDENDDRIIALNALMQMNAEAALPVLERVLARRDNCIALRKQATFLVSQKRSDRAAEILINTARNDPSSEVREQAVFWLGQVNQERAVEVLSEIVEKSNDVELQKKAVFSLTQVNGDRGQQILRDVAQNERAAKSVREDAIFWLGQRRSTRNAEFLRALYNRLTDRDLKEKIIFSLSQQGTEENFRWTLDIATNEREATEMRKQALFWAGQNRNFSVAEISTLYGRLRDREMKEQVIFVLSQRRESTAVDKLMDIAKNDSDRELRSKAIFWLGQSRDPRVPKFLEEIIR
jgi:HEAT repeat protein